MHGWDTYWKGTRDAEAYASGGVSHPTITSFWDVALSEFHATRDNGKILDIATGSGAVVEQLSKRTESKNFEVTCVDISAAAIDVVCGRFPPVTGVVADANSIPLDSDQFDLVTSQFGIEYAGLAAIEEARRLLAPGGTLILMMHIQPGVIFSECKTALDAIRRTQRSGFVAQSLRFFEAGFAAVRGADRAPYDRAARELNPAIQEVESILAEYGQQVAGDTIAKLYGDVQQIHGRIQYYEPNDVFGWLQTMENELVEYEERMASMCGAASDEKDFLKICENLRQQGLDIVTAQPLAVKTDDLPVAWILHAIRSN